MVRSNRSAPGTTYQERIERYHSEKKRWIANHPNATKSELDRAVRQLAEKYRV